MRKHKYSKIEFVLTSFFIGIICLAFIYCIIPKKKFINTLTKISIDINDILTNKNFNNSSKISELLNSRNYTVIAIGEQSHGTSEFFQIRNQLIELLTQNDEITKIGLEAPMAEVEYLNNFLLNDQGDIREILKTFRIYSYECQEFVDLINAIKESNKGRKNKISLFGFDFQNPIGALENMKKLKEQEPSFPVDSVIKLLHYYNMLSSEIDMHSFSKEDFDSLKYIGQGIFTSINSNDDKLFERYKRSYGQFLLLNDPASTNYDVKLLSKIRDSLMAQNVLEELSNDSKLIILAHNAHIQRRANPYSKPMGQFLNENLGRNYSCIGLTTSFGTFTAFNSTDGRVVDNNIISTPNKNSFEYYFSLTNKSTFFLETIQVLDKMKGDCLPTKYKLMPMVVWGEIFIEGNPLEDFDYIVHINRTSGTNNFYLK